MAYAIAMIEPELRKRAVAYAGISWTCLFFGPFPALYRGHILGFVGMTLMNIATLGLSMPVFIFVYNAWHYHSLLAQGYRPARQVMGEGELAASAARDRRVPPVDLFDAPRPANEPGLRLAMPSLPERLMDEAAERDFFPNRR
ncbi:hypothetical protein [Sneathiella sp.]|uniref:hypothetical protein n=1 Tax=Sneathiella sp. TaxID=1964365 RepID=UPI002FE19E53